MLSQSTAATIRPLKGVCAPWLDSVLSELAKLGKYAVVGLSNTAVSLVVLNLFYFFLAPTSSVVLVLGSTAAYAAGDLNAFFWNGRWTFGAGKATWQQFGRFALLSIACMALNAAIVWLSSGWLLALLPAWLLANAYQVSATISGGLGYVACRLWVFKPSSRGTTPTAVPIPLASLSLPVSLSIGRPLVALAPVVLRSGQR